jgi:hypothetical protein
LYALLTRLLLPGAGDLDPQVARDAHERSTTVGVAPQDHDGVAPPPAHHAGVADGGEVVVVGVDTLAAVGPHEQVVLRRAVVDGGEHVLEAVDPGDLGGARLGRTQDADGADGADHERDEQRQRQRTADSAARARGRGSRHHGANGIGAQGVEGGSTGRR